MRLIHSLAAAALALALAACSGIDVEPADTGKFAAIEAQRYAWRTDALKQGSPRDQLFILDRHVRRAVDRELAAKGYVLDPASPDFRVDFLIGPGVREGVPSEWADNLSTRPSAINRLPDGATVDNAHALSGTVDTERLAILLLNRDGSDILWHVMITKIVENANFADNEALRRNVDKAVHQGLRSLPASD
jgi:hypothetical protein